MVTIGNRCFFYMCIAMLGGFKDLLFFNPYVLGDMIHNISYEVG